MNYFCMNRHFNSIFHSTDEELVGLIRKNNDEAFLYLYERYLPKIRTMAFPFQGLGFDLEDLVQEATIGFYTAIQAYNFNSASFSTFCYLCMRRMLVSLVRQSSKKSAVPQASVIHTDNSLFSIPDKSDPEQEFIAKEGYYKLREKIESRLSEKERVILFEFLSGKDYKTIAEVLGVSRKTVDNALQRVRAKLK
ncbi:MAG: sigma-70 family RNA polymerase sigma factor [Clostridia bacterium]|nr:sigma-70 family RNA polymerase sigma factor [Clostridia bacterium]